MICCMDKRGGGEEGRGLRIQGKKGGEVGRGKKMEKGEEGEKGEEETRKKIK